MTVKELNELLQSKNPDSKVLQGHNSGIYDVVEEDATDLFTREKVKAVVLN